MQTCGDRWTDPLWGRTSTPIGPYSCGRRYGHPGVHAHDGHGAAALWRDGELLLSIQQIAPGVGDPETLAESYPELT